MPPKKVSASSTFLVDVAMIKLSMAMFQSFFLYVEEKGWPEASAMNNSANTLSMQMLNLTILTRTLAEEVDKGPPNEVIIIILSLSVHYTESKW